VIIPNSNGTQTKAADSITAIKTEKLGPKYGFAKTNAAKVIKTPGNNDSQIIFNVENAGLMFLFVSSFIMTIFPLWFILVPPKLICAKD
jgi:hypothetical protein